MPRVGHLHIRAVVRFASLEHNGPYVLVLLSYAADRYNAREHRLVIECEAHWLTRVILQFGQLRHYSGIIWHKLECNVSFN